MYKAKIEPFDINAMRLLMNRVRSGEANMAQIFWNRVDRSAGADGCWPWKGALTWQGYGLLRKGQHYMKTHRLAFALAYGPIDQTVVIRHRCNNPACCNPKHLKRGTHKDNAQDRRRAGNVKNRTLVAEQVLIIKQDYFSGKRTAQQLSNDFAVCTSTIEKIVQGVRWKNVAPELTSKVKREADNRRATDLG